MKRACFSVFALLFAALPAFAAEAVVFGAAISITGKTAKEGEYTRDGYQFAIDRINELGGIKVGGKTYKAELKYYDDETKSERSAQLFEKQGCVNCHSATNVLKDSVPSWSANSSVTQKPLRDVLSPQAMEGISCAVCHQTIGPVHGWPIST